MKKVKILTAILCILTLVLAVAIPLISSTMQGYYKAQIDDFSKDTHMLLEKKKQWATIGEDAGVFGYVSIGLACVFVVEHIIDRKKKQN